MRTTSAGGAARTLLKTCITFFKRCKRWQEQQRTLWRDVQEATKESRRITERTPIPKAFAGWRCSQAILDFLASTEAGWSYPKPDDREEDTASDPESNDYESDASEEGTQDRDDTERGSSETGE